MIVSDPCTQNPFTSHSHNEKVDIENRKEILDKLHVDEDTYASQFRNVFDQFAIRYNSIPRSKPEIRETAAKLLTKVSTGNKRKKFPNKS